MTAPTYSTKPRHTAYAERRWRRIPLGWSAIVNHGDGGRAWRPTLYLAMRWASIRHLRIELGRRTGAGRIAVALFHLGMLGWLAAVIALLTSHGDADNIMDWAYLFLGSSALVAGTDRLGAA